MTELRDRLQASLGETYRLDRELGGGGMSRVFVAKDMRLDREVVVKVLSPDLAAGVNSERFHREILVAAQLQHPHIVPVLGFLLSIVVGIPLALAIFPVAAVLALRPAAPRLVAGDAQGRGRSALPAVARLRHRPQHPHCRPDRLLPRGHQHRGGATQVDEELLDLGRVFGAPTWKVFLKIRLPNALPTSWAR